MNVLTLYIFREVVKGSLLAVIILLTLFNLFSFSDELKELGHGDYGLKQILWFLALTSPRVFYELLPSAALLGSLFVVGAMANNREIVAMRAAGLSIGWIVRSIMLAGLFLVMVAVAVGEFVAPNAERTARLLKTTALHDGVVMRSQYGLWLREGNRFINVRKILDDGSLNDVRYFELDDRHQLKAITQAEQGEFQGGQQWLLRNVKQTQIGDQQITAESHEQMPWQSTIDSDLLKVVVVDSENMSLQDLYNYIGFLKTNNQKSQSYELAFWSRLINPLVTFVMLLVSAPFVIGIGRGVGAGGRIMLGICIGMAFNIADRIIGNMGLVYNINPLLTAIFPSLVVFCAALFAVWRVS